MTQASCWQLMHSQPRHTAPALTGTDIPAQPGVYAWYHSGGAVYSGRALGSDGLRGRIWANHLRTGRDLSRSSFRRNVCAHLGIAPTSWTTVRPSRLTEADVEPVNRWIKECEVAWIVYPSAREAAAFERALHAEWLPPLSRR